MTIIDLRHQGSGAGQIGVSGANVSHGGVLIGSTTGTGAPLDVDFNASATTAAVTSSSPMSLRHFCAALWLLTAAKFS